MQIKKFILGTFLAGIVLIGLCAKNLDMNFFQEESISDSKECCETILAHLKTEKTNHFIPLFLVISLVFSLIPYRKQRNTKTKKISDSYNPFFKLKFAKGVFQRE